MERWMNEWMGAKVGEWATWMHALAKIKQLNSISAIKLNRDAKGFGLHRRSYLDHAAWLAWLHQLAPYLFIERSLLDAAQLAPRT